MRTLDDVKLKRTSIAFSFHQVSDVDRVLVPASDHRDVMTSLLDLLPYRQRWHRTKDKMGLQITFQGKITRIPPLCQMFMFT